jgi:hypothetical protein
MSTDHTQLLAADYLDNLESRPVEVLRSMRAECVEVETGVSYLRRLVHGALDIVVGELTRRRDGAEPFDADHLVERLSALLGEQDRPSGVGRLPQTLEPSDIDPGLQARYDHLVGEGHLSGVSDLDAVELTELADALHAFERELADRRLLLFGRIDTLQAEIARRYQTGQLQVDDLLRDPAP